MKKAIITLAVLVMAIGSTGFAQSKAEMKSKANELVFKQMGLVRDSYIVPQQANYNMIEEDVAYRTTYSYDESEYYLVEEFTEVNYGGVWQNETLNTYEYDFYGNVIEMMMAMWMGGDWMDFMKLSYTYDGDVLSEVVYQYNMNGTWTNNMKQVYNFNGDIWTVLFWSWNGTNWVSEDLYTYTRSGNTIELLMQYMEGGAWQNQEKQIMTLDFDENVTEIVDQMWENNSWENEEKVTYTYENGVYTQQLYEEWDGGAWTDEYKMTYEYDGMGNAKHGECFEFDGSDWAAADGNIEMAYGYNAESKDFYGHQVEMTYVDLTAINENAQTTFTVSPNPAQGEIHIQAEGFQKAEVYTLTGQKLTESLQNTLDVSGLASGVYLLKVVSLNGYKETQRIVVE